MNAVKAFIRDEAGLETVEYAIIAGLITVGAIVTILGVGTWVSGKFGELKTTLENNAPVK
jgi:pilus assembly protein Flp/PilA